MALGELCARSSACLVLLQGTEPSLGCQASEDFAALRCAGWDTKGVLSQHVPVLVPEQTQEERRW